jgi:hypothetical protein
MKKLIGLIFCIIFFQEAHEQEFINEPLSNYRFLHPELNTILFFNPSAFEKTGSAITYTESLRVYKRKHA